MTHWLTDWHTDNLKARDASASKKITLFIPISIFYIRVAMPIILVPLIQNARMIRQTGWKAIFFICKANHQSWLWFPPGDLFVMVVVASRTWKVFAILSFSLLFFSPPRAWSDLQWPALSRGRRARASCSSWPRWPCPPPQPTLMEPLLASFLTSGRLEQLWQE